MLTIDIICASMFCILDFPCPSLTQWMQKNVALMCEKPSSNKRTGTVQALDRRSLNILELQFPNPRNHKKWIEMEYTEDSSTMPCLSSIGQDPLVAPSSNGWGNRRKCVAKSTHRTAWEGKGPSCEACELLQGCKALDSAAKASWVIREGVRIFSQVAQEPKKTKESFNHNPCKKNKSTTVLVYNYSFKQKIEHEFFKAVANAMQLGPSQWAAQKLLLEVGECLFSICRPTLGKQHDFTSEIPIGPMGLPNVAVARAAFTPPNNPRNCESINLGIYFTI